MHEELVSELQTALRLVADPIRAAGEQRYLKSEDRFLGVTVPAGQRIARAFKSRHGEMVYADVRAIAAALWRAGMHEEKRLAVQLLGLYGRDLVPEDWPMLLAWVRDAGSWDLIDEISAHLLAVLLDRYPVFEHDIDRWIADSESWVRRAALVSQVPRIRAGSVTPERARALCDAVADDPTYFVRKALGWVLRECAVRDPDGTCAWLIARRRRLPRPAVREATRKLDDARRRAVMGD